MPGLGDDRDTADRDISGPWPMRWLTRGITNGAMIVPFTIALGGLARARTAAEAEALAERAMRHIHDVGRDQAFADFSRRDGGFVDGELYVFCLDESGVVVAHGDNPQLVGHALQDAGGPGGRPLSDEIISVGLTQGHAWLEYRWPNPINRRVELKAVFGLKVDDRTVCGSGSYKETLP